MPNQEEGNNSLEGAMSKFHDSVEGHRRLVEQEGKLAEQKAKLEAANILRERLLEKEKKEAEKAPPTPQATQIITLPQTPVVEGSRVRNVWGPLESLVRNGPSSVEGVEPFGERVLQHISEAVGSYGVDGSKWMYRDNKLGDYTVRGLSNGGIYICNVCSAVQRRDTKDKLTTPAEYALIHRAFELANILLNEDTASCSEIREVKRPPAPGYEQPSHAPDASLSERELLLDEETVRRFFDGEWYQRNEGWWNSLYIFCPQSLRAFSRKTGGEFREPYVANVFKVIPLSPYENLCPINPLYNLLDQRNVPEAARISASTTNCPGCLLLSQKPGET